MPKYVLTGTSGRLGSRVLQYMLRQESITPQDLIVSSANPSRLSQISQQYGVEVRYGDYKDPRSLRAAFAGADVLFLVSHPSATPRRVEYHKDAIEIAHEVGVRTVIYTSMMFGGESGLDSTIGVQQGHIATTKYLATSGIDHIVIREGLYAQFWTYFAGVHPELGFNAHTADSRAYEWVIPNDGGIAYVDWDDLAEGTANVIANAKQYVGQTLRFTGPRSTTIGDIANLVTSRTGRKVDLRLVGAEAAVKHRLAYTSDPLQRQWIEEQWGPLYAGLARGEGEIVDPVLESLLSRPVRGIEEMADELLPSR